MSSEAYQDEIIILRVQNAQTADKYAVGFSRKHGKIAFMAYGARYPKNVMGRLVQPFAKLAASFTPGQRLDVLRQCESLASYEAIDVETFAYGAVIAEVVENLTEERNEQEQIFELLDQVWRLLPLHNKRLVTLSAICKILSLCGLAPVTDVCTSCRETVTEKGYFSLPQGGFLCKQCATGEELPCSMETLELLKRLQKLDFEQSERFTVKGAELSQLERILYKFLFYQTDKELKSLRFLAQL